MGVIVSEWMGYFLIFENMVPSVLAVRDRYLKPKGKMIPEAGTIVIAAYEGSPSWIKIEGADEAGDVIQEAEITLISPE